MAVGIRRAKKTQFNVHEAKTQLSKLLSRVEKGEIITIAKANQPVAQLVAFPRPRKLGTAKGLIWMAPDAFDTDPELEDLFYNGPVFPEP